MFLIRFKREGLAPVSVKAERVEFQADHIVLLNSNGKLVALFLADLVESWSELPG